MVQNYIPLHASYNNCLHNFQNIRQSTKYNFLSSSSVLEVVRDSKIFKFLQFIRIKSALEKGTMKNEALKITKRARKTMDEKNATHEVNHTTDIEKGNPYNLRKKNVAEVTQNDDFSYSSSFPGFPKKLQKGLKISKNLGLKFSSSAEDVAAVESDDQKCEHKNSFFCKLTSLREMFI